MASSNASTPTVLLKPNGFLRLTDEVVQDYLLGQADCVEMFVRQDGKMLRLVPLESCTPESLPIVRVSGTPAVIVSPAFEDRGRLLPEEATVCEVAAEGGHLFVDVSEILGEEQPR